MTSVPPSTDTPGVTAPRLLWLPGWRSSGPTHWQTIWQTQHGGETVQQADWEWPRRGDWMARLDEALQQAPTPVLLVAHSLGCHLVAAWAGHSRHTGQVRGALLVAPPDLERADLPPQLAGWRGEPARRLPFAGTVVLSTDDPHCHADRATAMATAWGAATMDIGARGHINADSGLADWPEGWAIVRALAGDRGQSSAW